MVEFEYYPKDENNSYAFFYDPESNIAWAVHMPKIPLSQVGSGREVGSLEGIKSKKEASEKLKEMVDKL